MAHKAKKPPEDQALEEEFIRPPKDYRRYARLEAYLRHAVTGSGYIPSSSKNFWDMPP